MLQPRRIKEVLTMPKVDQALGSQLTRQYDDPDVGHGTYLTLDASRSIKDDHVKNYG